MSTHQHQCAACFRRLWCACRYPYEITDHICNDCHGEAK